MVEKIEAYRTKDGRIFEEERPATLHDAALALRAIDNPRLTSSIPAILESADAILAALSPLAGDLEKPPSVDGETTLELVRFGEGEPYGYVDEHGGFRKAGVAA